jgi:hypothetical protein
VNVPLEPSKTTSGDWGETLPTVGLPSDLSSCLEVVLKPVLNAMCLTEDVVPEIPYNRQDKGQHGAKMREMQLFEKMMVMYLEPAAQSLAFVQA